MGMLFDGPILNNSILFGAAKAIDLSRITEVLRSSPAGPQLWFLFWLYLKPVAGNATLIADQSLIVANYGVKWRMQKDKTKPNRRLILCKA